MEIRWALLDTPQRERLNRSITCFVFQESLNVEVVHLVIEINRRWMAGGTLRFAKEQSPTRKFASRGLRWVEPARDGQFRRWRKVEHVLHLGHVRHRDSVQNVHAFLDRVNLIAIEVSGALLKLGKVLNRP